MSAIEERFRRKLNTLYDSINSGNFKMAVRDASDDKIKHLPSVRAWKAFALDRQGKKEEALKLARKVANESPVDDEVLSTLCMVFRASQLGKEIVELLERANALAPQDLQIAENLFHAFVSVRDFPKMQHQAMKLYKLTADPKFLLWVGMSIWLGEELRTRPIMESEEDASTTQKKLALASAMFTKGEKARNSKSLKKREQGWLQEVQLEVIKRRNLYADGIAHVDSRDPPAKDRDLQLSKALFLRKSGKLLNAAEVLRKALAEIDADDWRLHKALLEVERLIVFANSENENEKVPEQRVSLEKFLEELHKKEPFKRGPALALVFLHFRVFCEVSAINSKIENGEINAENVNKEADFKAAAASAKTLVHNLESYLLKFDSKACVFGDVRNLLLPFVFRQGETLRSDFVPGTSEHPSISSMGVPVAFQLQFQKTDSIYPPDVCAALVPFEIRTNLVRFLEARMEEMRPTTLGKKTTKKSLRSFIACVQILRFIGAYEPGFYETSKIDELAHSLLNEYKGTAELAEESKKEGGQREVQAGDDLVLLASHFFLDLAERSEDADLNLNLRLKVCAILETAKLKSPYNFQFNLLLIETYSSLKIFAGAAAAFNTLEAKFIQVDSLSHLVLSPASQSGFLQEALQHCRNIKRFATRAFAENPGYLKDCFELGNFPKVFEILRMDHRILFSSQLSIARVEAFHLELLLFHSKSLLTAMDFIQKNVEPAAEPENRYKQAHSICQVGVQDLTLLCENQDFQVQVSWDDPCGMSAQYALREVKNQSLGQSQRRQATSLMQYQQHWKTNTMNWLKLKVGVSTLLHGLASKRGDLCATLFPNLRSLYLQVGLTELAFPKFKGLDMESLKTALKQGEPSLVSFEKEKVNSEKFEKAQAPKFFWKASLSAFEASASLAQNSDAFKPDAAVLTEAFCLTLDLSKAFVVSLTHVLKADLEALQKFENTSNNLLADSISMPLFWVVLQVRIWMSWFPAKKKNKKNKKPMQQPVKEVKEAVRNARDVLKEVLKLLSDKFQEDLVDLGDIDLGRTPVDVQAAAKTKVLDLYNQSRKKTSKVLKEATGNLVTLLCEVKF